MSGHTPGPWSIKWGFNICGPDRNCPGNERMVANAGSHSNNTFAEVVTAENEANARLIAAAPDLLRACKMVADMAVSWAPLTPGDIAEVTAAIAKAEGK